MDGVFGALLLIALVAAGTVAANLALYFFHATADAGLQPKSRASALLMLAVGAQATVGVWLERQLRCNGWHLTALTASGLAVLLLPDSPFWWIANYFGSIGAWLIAAAFTIFVLSIPLGTRRLGSCARELHGSGRP